ncbi:hypothetical protein ACQEPB_03725 [Novosphingobium fluoreni]
MSYSLHYSHYPILHIDESYRRMLGRPPHHLQYDVLSKEPYTAPFNNLP